jgi:ABC-type amino acid transport system permease subunit
MMIILILSVFALYSLFTSTEYVQVLRFVVGLPWDTELVGRVTAESDGAWTFTPPKGLRPGKYRLYAEFLDEDDNVLGQSDLYLVEIPRGAEPVEMAPLMEPPGTWLEVQTSTPTIAGTTTPEVTVHIYDDLIFSKIPRKIWNSNGVLLTIKVTLIAYSIALILGLIAGLGRVSGRSPDLSAGLLWRLLVGLGLAALLGVLWPYWRDFKLLVAVVLGIEIVIIILYVGFVVTPFLRDGTRVLFAKLPTMITEAEALPAWISSSLLQLLDRLPKSIDLGGLPGAMIGLAFGYGAYLAEVYRSGISVVYCPLWATTLSPCSKTPRSSPSWLCRTSCRWGGSSSPAPFAHSLDTILSP